MSLAITIDLLKSIRTINRTLIETKTL